MKTKILIVGMLLLSLVVLSGCDSDRRIAIEKCLTETAEVFCAERDCVVKKITWKEFMVGTGFTVLKGEYREYTYLSFSDKEIKSCENTVEI